MIEVMDPGILTTLQDAGRPGSEAYGVPRSGPLDPFLAAVANRLVGNNDDAPLLEFALIGPVLHFHQQYAVSVVGFALHYECNGVVTPERAAFVVDPGSVLRFVSMKGWFGYLAIGGGFDGEKFLGSVSTYLAGGIGQRLKKNQILNCKFPTLSVFSLRSKDMIFQKEPILKLLSGPHTARFSEAMRQQITEQSYRIGAQSNRMGIHLEGAPLKPPPIRRSTPALPGTVQIPPSGHPIILGPEGPTTGGYAQMGVLSRTSWTDLVTARPGDTIRFEWTDLASARDLWNNRQAALDSIFA